MKKTGEQELVKVMTEKWHVDFFACVFKEADTGHLKLSISLNGKQVVNMPVESERAGELWALGFRNGAEALAKLNSNIEETW